MLCATKIAKNFSCAENPCYNRTTERYRWRAAADGRSAPLVFPSEPKTQEEETMIYAILKGDELQVYYKSCLVYNCGLGHLSNKQLQVSGNTVRVIGESSPGVLECDAYEFDSEGNFREMRQELV